MEKKNKKQRARESDENSVVSPVLRMFHKDTSTVSLFSLAKNTCAKTFDFSLSLVEITHGNFFVSAKVCLGFDGNSRSCGCRLTFSSEFIQCPRRRFGERSLRENTFSSLLVVVGTGISVKDAFCLSCFYSQNRVPTFRIPRDSVVVSLLSGGEAVAHNNNINNNREHT